MSIEGPNNNPDAGKKEKNNSGESAPEVIFEDGHWVLRSSFAALNEADEAFENFLKENNWNEKQAFFVALDLHEILVNAFMHGNLGIGKHGPEKTATQAIEEALAANPDLVNKKIIIDFSITTEDGVKKLDITVTDEGDGFDYNKIADPNSEENKKKTEGRGVNWNKIVFDEVEYIGKGNIVHLMVKEKEPVV